MRSSDRANAVRAAGGISRTYASVEERIHYREPLGPDYIKLARWQQPVASASWSARRDRRALARACCSRGSAPALCVRPYAVSATDDRLSTTVVDAWRRQSCLSGPGQDPSAAAGVRDSNAVARAGVPCRRGGHRKRFSHSRSSCIDGCCPVISQTRALPRAKQCLHSASTRGGTCHHG